MAPKFLARNKATEFLRERGIQIANSALGDWASKERGPKYSIVNGRAVYTEQALLEWLQIQIDAAPAGRGGKRSKVKLTGGVAA